MVESSDELMRRIDNATSFVDLEDVRYYMQYYRQDIPDFYDLMDQLVAKEIEFSPGCPARLTFDMFPGGGYKAFTPTQKQANDICMRARSMRVPQLSLYFQQWPELASDAGWIRNSNQAPLWDMSADERKRAEKRISSEEEDFLERMRKGQRKTREYEEVEPEGPFEEARGERVKKPKRSPAEVRIDEQAAKLARQLEESEEEMERGISAEVEKRREIERELEALRQERAGVEKTVSVHLTGTEAGYIRSHIKELDGLFYNLSPEAGEWSLSVVVKKESDKILVDNLVTRAQNYGEEQRKSRAESKQRETAPGYERVSEILCRVFTKETGQPCSMVKASLDRLANDMLFYALDNRFITEWDQFDWESLQLFAKSGSRFLTRGQMKDAYDSFVSRVQGNVASEVRKEVTGFCEPETVYPAFYTVYIYGELKRLAVPIPEALERKYKDAMGLLTDCGYNENMYREYVNGAVSFYGEMHQDFFRLADQEIKSFTGGYPAHASDLAKEVYDFLKAHPEPRGVDIREMYRQVFEKQGVKFEDLAKTLYKLAETGEVFEISLNRWKLV